MGLLRLERIKHRWELQTKTHIWTIGHMMRSLMTLQTVVVDISKPFKPNWDILGEESKSLTYAKEIASFPYSQELKNLIWACLYEKPDNRPTLFELKRRVEIGYQEAIKALQEVGSLLERCAKSMRMLHVQIHMAFGESFIDLSCSLSSPHQLRDLDFLSYWK